MKFTIFFLFNVSLIFLPHKLDAQKATDSIRFVFSVWESEQRRIIMMNLPLSEFEKAGFWYVCDSYFREKEPLEVQYLQILHTCQQAGQMESRELHEALLANELSLAKVRKKYYRKFCSVLSDERAGAFMWMDDSLRQLFRMKLRGLDLSVTLSQPAVYSAGERYSHAHE